MVGENEISNFKSDKTDLYPSERVYESVPKHGRTLSPHISVKGGNKNWYHYYRVYQTIVAKDIEWIGVINKSNKYSQGYKCH